MIKLLLCGLLILFTGIFIGSLWTYPLRAMVRVYYEKEYANQMFKCDHAMRENFIAKAKVLRTPNERTSKELFSTEVALLDCHEYDKFRKQLGSLGLTQDDLGQMGLKAIEAKGSNIKSLVRYHEIRY